MGTRPEREGQGGLLGQCCGVQMCDELQAPGALVQEDTGHRQSCGRDLGVDVHPEGSL